MPVKMTSLTYTRGATVNRGNFNSDRIDISVVMEIEDENPDEVYAKARDWVKAKLKADLKEE